MAVVRTPALIRRVVTVALGCMAFNVQAESTSCDCSCESFNKMQESMQSGQMQNMQEFGNCYVPCMQQWGQCSKAKREKEEQARKAEREQ